MIILFIVILIDQIKYSARTSIDVPHVNTVLVWGYEVLLVGTYAYWMQLFFFARFISLQVLPYLLGAWRFWFRHDQAFASLEHSYSWGWFGFLLVFDCEELHISCCSSKEQWLASSTVIQPLNTLYTLRYVLRVQNIETFCLGLKFCQIIKICKTLFIPDPFENNHSPTAVTHRKYVTSCVECNRWQQVMPTNSWSFRLTKTIHEVKREGIMLFYAESFRICPHWAQDWWSNTWWRTKVWKISDLLNPWFGLRRKRRRKVTMDTSDTRNSRNFVLWLFINKL